MKTSIFYLHALSPVHAGIGQAVGVVDLPIARARATNIPIIPGSGLKGVLRDEFEDKKTSQIMLFGPEKISDSEKAHAGALSFGDAHLLLMPVRSLNGVMAFVTCPFVLRRYSEDLARAGVTGNPEVPVVTGEMALCAENCVNHSKGKILLEDLDLDAETNAAAKSWGEFIAARVHADRAEFRQEIAGRIVILSDELFVFLVETATEVRARVRINDRGVVEKGALWYEENLPSESVLWGVIGIGKSRAPNGQEAMDESAVESAWLDTARNIAAIQIGGKATVGRGLVRFLA